MNDVLVIYSLRECEHCEAARRFLRHRGVVFVERDVRQEPGAIHDLTKLTGESIVPTIVRGGDVQVGWDEVRVAQMIDAPLPAEEDDPLIASIEAAVEAICGNEASGADPRDSSGTTVVSAELRTSPGHDGKDWTSPAE